MTQPSQLITGEHRRVYDDRYRIALPPELLDPLLGDSSDAVLAKEREGCLSLWHPQVWKLKVEDRVALVAQKMQLNLYDQDVAKVQRFTRLLSTRSRTVKLGQRGRLLVPEGFREFLSAEPNSEVLVVGAGLCVEIWNPRTWNEYLRQDIGEFNTLFKELL